eukprot:TRINITY_DN14121_c2_g1_i1.p2 TRINITY_DN14121_c2_g1~~TRINITY_DN14121_c2_g1_i1.p2  ORF type:complete len:153 (-),score=6.10 TRINITY_DN14121_c2_g1_i1:216-674(-)
MRSRRAISRILGGSTRRQHHNHLAAFHLGFIFDLGEFRRFVFHPIKQIHSQILVRHFAAPETQCYLDLVAFVEKAPHRTHFDVVIVGIDVRAHLDFFDLERLLFFSGLGGLLLRLVFEPSIVEDLADGRLGVWRDFNQIESCLGGKLQRVVY